MICSIFFERFQLALNSQIGTIFIGLLGFLLLLLGAYAFMAWKTHRKDRLFYLYQNHYTSALQEAKELAEISQPQVEFFGRQTLVTLPNGQLGRCLIPLPHFSDDVTKDQFRVFQRVIATHSHPHLAPCLWKEDRKTLILVEGHTHTSQKKPLLGLHHYFLDKRLSSADRENILLTLSQALNALHSLHTDAGKPLYHGFLLPRYILLDLDATAKLQTLLITMLGVPFALGPQKLQEALYDLRKGHAIVDRTPAQEIIEQASLLPAHLTKGQKDDFYSFAAISILMLSGKRHFDPKDIAWSALPEKWRPFLKACLEEKPENRPDHFQELDDWRLDPELALSCQSFTAIPIQEMTPPKSFLEIFTDLKANTGEQKQNVAFEQAARAIKAGNWGSAKKQYKELLKLHPQHPEILVHYAIACHELGDTNAAILHYNQAKELDPRTAKKFREHLAYKM